MRLTSGQKALIERELPIIQLDNELQYRMLQKVLQNWNNSRERNICHRLNEIIRDLVDGQDSEENLQKLKNKLSMLRFGCTVTQHLRYCINYSEADHVWWLYENENSIRYRWVVKILLANRGRLNIKLEG